MCPRNYLGGGFQDQDFLSTQPLMWMWQQAREAGVPFKGLKPLDLEKFHFVESMNYLTPDLGPMMYEHDSRWGLDKLLEWLTGGPRQRPIYYEGGN